MLGRFVDPTAVVSLRPPNDRGSLHVSLSKGSNPTPSLVCWSVFPPVLDNNYSGVEAPWWDGGERASLGAAGVSERTLPVPLAAAVTVDDEHREVKGVLIARWAFQGLRVLPTAPQRPPA